MPKNSHFPFFIFFSEVAHDCNNVIISYQLIKREQTLFQHEVFFIFLRYLRLICYVHLDWWISKPSKTLASCTAMLHGFCSTFVIFCGAYGSVSNFSDCFFLVSVTRISSIICHFLDSQEPTVQATVANLFISRFTNFVFFLSFLPFLRCSIGVASCVLFPKLHLQAQNSLQHQGRF